MKQQYTNIIQEKIQMRLKVARDLKSTGAFQQAIQEYIRTLFLDRNNGEAYKELADIYLEMGDLSPAISLYSRALAVSFDIILEDKLQSVILMKGRMLMEQSDWNNFLEGGEFEQFGTYLQYYQTEINQLKKTEQNSFLEPFIKAHAFALTNYLVYAIHEIEKALKVNSNNIQAFLLRGKILWALNKVPEGNLDYWRAHSLNRDHQEVQEFLRFIIPQTEKIISETKFLVVQNSVEQCQLNIKKGLELYPNNTELLLIKSYLHRSIGEFEQALRDLDVCLKNRNSNVEESKINHQIAITYNEMAMFLYQKGKYEDSLTLFNEALKYKSDDWGILVNRGDAKKELKKIEEALQDYEKAMKLSNNRIEVINRTTQVLFLIAIDLFNKRQLPKSIEMFDQAINLNPQAPDLYFNRGKCYLEMQQFRSALKDFEKTLKLDTKHYQAQNLILSLKSAGQNSKNIIEVGEDI